MNNLKAIKIIVLFFVSIIGLMFAANFFMNLMAYLTMAVWCIAGAAVTGAIGFTGYKLLAASGKMPGPLLIGKKSYKVFDITRKQVYLFRSEPSLVDLAKAQDELHLAQLELKGEVFPLRNEEHVEIVEDTGKESIKVRVKNAEKVAGFQQEGWVCRSALVPE
jgi:hypothetical protein